MMFGKRGWRKKALVTCFPTLPCHLVLAPPMTSDSAINLFGSMDGYPRTQTPSQAIATIDGQKRGFLATFGLFVRLSGVTGKRIILIRPEWGIRVASVAVAWQRKYPDRIQNSTGKSKSAVCRQNGQCWCIQSVSVSE